MIEGYKGLIKDQDRTREAILLLERATEDPAVFARLTKDFKQVFSLVEELDSNQYSEMKFMDSLGSIEKLKKTSAFIDESIRGSFLRLYGIDGINFANMEEVYNPLMSGLGSMHKVRQHLLSRGMTAQFTDILAAKYIKKVEEKD